MNNENKGNNSLFKNSIFNAIYRLLNALFPLITASYVSHVIFASGVGKVASAQNIVQYFVLIASLGIPNYGVREIAKSRMDVEEKTRVFSELFLLNMITTLISIVVYYGMICFLPQFVTEKKLYVIVGGSIILNIINVDWYYQGVEEYVYIAKRSIFVKIVSIASIFLFVKKHNDYIIYALISVVAIAGNYIFNIANLHKHDVHLVIKGIGIRRHLKPVLILLCTTISIELYTLLDTTMITYFCSSEDVAYYSNSVKIVKMIIVVVTSLGTVLLPRLSRYVKEGNFEGCNKIVNTVLSILIFIFLPTGIGIILISDNLVPLLFGNTFMPAVLTLKIAALLIYALGFSNLFGTQVLLSFGAENKLLLCTIVGAVSNICMNLTLIPTYQENGAAVASVISEVIVTTMTFVFSRKMIKYRINIRFLILSIIATVFMTIFVCIVNCLITNQIFNLIIAISGAILIYFGINIMFKNPILIDLKAVIKKDK